MIRQKFFIPHPSNKWELVKCHYQIIWLRIRLRFFCGPKSNRIITTFWFMFGLLMIPWLKMCLSWRLVKSELIYLLELGAWSFTEPQNAPVSLDDDYFVWITGLGFSEVISSEVKLSPFKETGEEGWSHFPSLVFTFMEKNYSNKDLYPCWAMFFHYINKLLLSLTDLRWVTSGLKTYLGSFGFGWLGHKDNGK